MSEKHIEGDGCRPLPRLSYARVMSTRRIIQRALTRFIGFRMDDGIQTDIAAEIYGKLARFPGFDGQYEAGPPDAGNPFFNAIKATLANRFSAPFLEKPVILKIAQIIAGNLYSLRVGQPALPWRGQSEEEWVLLVVTGAARKFTPMRRVPGGELRLHTLMGSPSGETFNQYFTDTALLRVARFIGMSPKWSTVRLHPFEFVQMKFVGKLRIGTDLFISEYRELPSLNLLNRKMVKARRMPERVCPNKYVIPCHACHVGFDVCPKGVHRRTMSRNSCPRCRSEGYFDPDFPEQKVCLHCQVSAWRSAG